MKYMIVGAGGTGGVLGFNLTESGKDVTLIARGEHLAKMQEKGLTLHRQWCHTRKTIPVKACDMESYEISIKTHCKEQTEENIVEDKTEDAPDVIFVCVKGYSLDSVVPFLRNVAGPDTIILPILNIFGTGGKLQPQIPDSLVLDGCIYVSATIREPGELAQNGEILRVVFGTRGDAPVSEKQEAMLQQLEKDLNDSNIRGLRSHHIETACLKKFSYVSPAGAAGLFYQAKAGDFQQEGPQREMLIALIREISNLADAMGYGFDDDYVKINLDIMSKLDPKADTSMQRDVAAGRQSEIDGLVYEVVRLGEKYQVALPTYQAVAERLKKKY